MVEEMMDPPPIFETLALNCCTQPIFTPKASKLAEQCHCEDAKGTAGHRYVDELGPTLLSIGNF